MISCTEFIPAYSELFKFLHSLGGKRAVIEFWESLSDEYLGNLRQLVSEKGLRGCFEYWNKTLNEEAADFLMTLDEEQGVFRIEMRSCPSKRLLLDQKHIEPYKFYCDHCAVLYRRAVEPFGFECETDLDRSSRGVCTLTITEKR